MVLINLCQVIKQLDREATARYELTIVITDGRHSNMTHVTVQIDDVNDNAPQCAQVNISFLMFECVSLRLAAICE